MLAMAVIIMVTMSMVIMGMIIMDMIIMVALNMWIVHSLPAFSNVVKRIYNTFVPASSQEVSLISEPALPAPQAN
jgi:hypothetical protein